MNGEFSLRNCRILELADRPTFKRLLPAQTTYYFTGRGEPQKRSARVLFVGEEIVAGHADQLELLQLSRALSKREFGLLAVTALQKPNWSRQRTSVVNIAHLVGTMMRQPRLRAIYLARFAKRAGIPIVVIDRRDEPTITDDNLSLLQRCTLFFKRELPQNHWNALLHATARDTDIHHLEKQPHYRDAVARLRPLPLPVCIRDDAFSEPREEKTTDVFFSGNVASATHRAHGLRTLEQLAAHGYRIDVTTERLPQDEYLERCARAWLVWSPEGQGWQCWRHFEAVLVGSVPVINYPSISCYEPFVDREHCFYYAPDRDSLERTIISALADKDRLRQMTAAAQQHLRRSYSPDAMIAYFDQQLAVA